MNSVVVSKNCQSSAVVQSITSHTKTYTISPDGVQCELNECRSSDNLKSSDQTTNSEMVSNGIRASTATTHAATDDQMRSMDATNEVVTSTTNPTRSLLNTIKDRLSFHWSRFERVFRTETDSPQDKSKSGELSTSGGIKRWFSARRLKSRSDAAEPSGPRVSSHLNGDGSTTVKELNADSLSRVQKNIAEDRPSYVRSGISDSDKARECVSLEKLNDHGSNFPISKPEQPDVHPSPNRLSTDLDQETTAHSPSYLRASLSAHGYPIHMRSSLKSSGERPTTLPNIDSHRKPLTIDASATSWYAHHPPSVCNGSRTAPVPTTLSLSFEQPNLSSPHSPADVSSPIDINGFKPDVMNSPNSSCISPHSMHEHSSTPEPVVRRRNRNNLTSSPDNQRIRSSLIIMAISQASPRARLGVSITEETENDVSIDNELNHKTAFFPATPSPCGLESAGDGPSPATRPMTNGVRDNGDDQIAGYRFLRIVDTCQADLVDSINQSEADLSTSQLNEEVAGLLRSTIGKARLLIAEKFAQFRGLCQENIDDAQLTDESMKNKFAPMADDLHGFWDLVMIEVDELRSHFDRITRMRATNWQWEQEVILPTQSVGGAENGTVKKQHHRLKKSANPKQSSNSTKKKDNIDRMKARERLAAAKREMLMKQSVSPATGNEDILLIV